MSSASANLKQSTHHLSAENPVTLPAGMNTETTTTIMAATTIGTTTMATQTITPDINPGMLTVQEFIQICIDVRCFPPPGASFDGTGEVIPPVAL